MTFLGVVSRAFFVRLTKGPRHHGEAQALLEFEFSTIRYRELHGAPDDLRVPMAHEIHIGVEVPVEVLDAVEFRPVAPPCDSAVTRKYRELRTRALGADYLSPKRPADEAIVAEVLQAKAEA